MIQNISFKHLKPVITAGLALMISLSGCSAKAEPVDLSIQQETVFGQSVFLSADHPLFGDGDITQAVKLSPHAYPTWSLNADLPNNLDLEFSYLVRQDGAGDLGDPGNGTVVQTQQIVTEVEEETFPVYVNVPEFPDQNENSPLEILNKSGSTVHFELLPSPVTALSTEGEFKFLGYDVPSQFIDRGFYMRPVFNNNPLFMNPDRFVIQKAWSFLNFDQVFLQEINPDSFNFPDEFVPPRNENFSFTLTGFPQRQINILLPRGYDLNSNFHKRYPVIYMQDGQNVFSPGGAFGSWDADITITDMISRGELPEVIVVAIDNTNERFAEYTPEFGEVLGTPGRGGEFLNAIRDELIPKINTDYRTRTEPEFTLHVGSSLGGLLGYYAAFEFDDTFGSVIAMSPSTQIATQDLINLAATNPDQTARLYLDSGNEGNSNDGYQNTVTVRDAMIANEHVYGPDFFYKVGIGNQHNEAAWRERLPDALRWWAGPVIEKITASPVEMQTNGWVFR